ncbi:DUF1801 domain-containing protein [Sphingomonas sp. AOB5]|uniref:DUF1801 domain-containing protein n=1 Tax=Sphingomonas sp. AOB5 TaxID=3034017 RepID=UPI0023F6F95F|nr:DUF1801 domain-containing protein [Sphingomonas sp. AOB5]MDF7775001.1 DUF1801 domain-containing protein [Sphingomonas sp. AOB5]
MSKTGLPTAKDAEAVAAYLATLDHPHKDGILLLRQIVLAAHPGITERIKWNAPSFYRRDDFATMHLRPPGIGLVLHTGVKAKGLAPAIDDPESLLKWPAKDRAIAVFRDSAALEARRAALTAILRQWIAAMAPAP